MTPGHSRWEEFCHRLRCALVGREVSAALAWAWSDDDQDAALARCEGEHDARGVPHATAASVLAGMGLDVPSALAALDALGAVCDCRILFDLADRSPR